MLTLKRLGSIVEPKPTKTKLSNEELKLLKEERNLFILDLHSRGIPLEDILIRVNSDERFKSIPEKNSGDHSSIPQTLKSFRDWIETHFEPDDEDKYSATMAEYTQTANKLRIELGTEKFFGKYGFKPHSIDAMLTQCLDMFQVESKMRRGYSEALNRVFPGWDWVPAPQESKTRNAGVFTFPASPAAGLDDDDE